jgi:UDPglucose--hexose-1-phosphate uridylyltransferase
MTLAFQTLAFQIERLLNFGVQKRLIEPDDVLVIRNYLLSEFNLKEPHTGEIPEENLEFADPILQSCADILHIENVTERDLFAAKIMGYLTPRQSEIVKNFWSLYAQSPSAATDYFYNLSINSNYIQKARVDKNLYWRCETEFGSLEITINLSKPEKDPKEIAAAKNVKETAYPKCALCAENAGFEGDLNRPARQNHRVVPVEISGERWFFQYSPYLYYNEHCILLNEFHFPMAITKKTFERLLSFIKKFPKYFMGSNADLPIVGGSILSHDHFQGGRHNFPIEFAKPLYSFEAYGADGEIIDWPVSTIRLRSADADVLIESAWKITQHWRAYSNYDAFIFAERNTVTPIARFKNGVFEMDLALRNNVTTDEHPLGVFHPHADLHHIKKENIGLIEVMGLAILPGRLLYECNEILEKKETENALKHRDWINYLNQKYDALNWDILRFEIGKKMSRVLKDAGVYKNLEDFKKFLDFCELTKN